MAYVKIGQIKATPAKAIKYIVRDDATNDGLFVSTNTAVIDPSDHVAIAQAMGATTQRVGVSRPRVGSVLAHHVIQSFDPSETVSPEVAHRVGVKLAEAITGGEHEYVIATHLDKGHVHNHIIFNAVNMQTGRKFRAQRGTLREMRLTSDELCVEAGLKVMPAPKRTGAEALSDFYLAMRGTSHKRFLQTEIDKAAARATDWQAFESLLERAGVETNRRSGSTTFRDESMGRAMKDWRLGEAYTETAIMARLSRQDVSRLDVDRSMIVREDGDAVTVRVPGTRGQLHLTVQRSQLVQHGRTLRAYVPVHAKHALADRRGRYAQTVGTAGLYDYFSRPKELTSREVAGRYAGALRGDLKDADLSTWSGSLTALRQMQDRVNTKARWLRDEPDVEVARLKAYAELAGTRAAFQSQLVALSDALDDPDRQVGHVEVLAAQLRLLDRDVEKLKRDVGVLDALAAPRTERTETTERKVPTVKEQITATAARLSRERATAEQQRHTDASGRAEARTDSDNDRMVSREDHENDRLQGDADGDPTVAHPKTLAQKIQERARALSRPTDDDDSRGRGRTR